MLKRIEDMDPHLREDEEEKNANRATNNLKKLKIYPSLIPAQAGIHVKSGMRKNLG